ncbi:aryl-sulfate sulfotransferase, partial [Candidatus Eisenbacteria bacterium]
MRRLLFGLGLVAILSSPLSAQEPYEGETLVSPMTTTTTHLIDMDGASHKTWHGADRPASMAYLLADGSILRPCRHPEGAFMGAAAGGRVQRIDADDTVVWDYLFSTDDYQQHHDIEPMPNGNVLVVAWERKTNVEAIAAGRQGISGEMWPTLIAEIEPVGATSGTVVWEWHAWDHLIQDADPIKPGYGVIADHPELIDINYGSLPPTGGDWLHINAIDYDPVYDQIIFCSRPFGEIFVIDHSTTSEEVAGHTGGSSGMGGDILYRWGNPQAYDRGSSGDQYFFAPHGATWINSYMPGAGNILVY